MAQRRCEGRCFNCPELFTADHHDKCSMRGIYMMEVTDDSDCPATDATEVEISLSALTGIQNGSTFNLTTTVSDSSIPALVDSGSTHCFMATATAARVGLHPVPRPGLSVAVANGERVTTSGVCQATPVRIGDDTFPIDIYVIPLEGHQLVLGCQWLRTLGPIIWEFQLKSMTFWNGDHHVKWSGIGASPTVHAATLASKDVLNLLLHEFQDVFAEPSGLPPQRQLDHRIHLLPDTGPVVVHPYRYPQLLKDEIERQCTEMLQQGVIHPSTQLFLHQSSYARTMHGFFLSIIGLSIPRRSATCFLYQLWMSFWMNYMAPNSSPNWIFGVATTKCACILMILPRWRFGHTTATLNFW